MGWVIRYHKDAKKFLKKLDEDRVNLILRRLDELKEGLHEGVIPFKRLDIRKLKGKWEGFFRLRIGEFRVIFKIDLSRKEILVYHIHFRGKVY
ncbi:type II toxin-antitoxin system RelE family toxin [Archaeoglobus sp.]